jgi:hypothetical protein
VITVADQENPTQADVVLIDRRDSALVFAQVSPGLVSTPNLGSKVRIVANFTDEELEEADGLYGTSSDVVFELIGRLLFLGANIVSVDTAPAGAPPVTMIEVTDERQLQATVDTIGALVGEVEGRVSDTVLEGVDTQITLGMSYLEHELGRATTVTPDDTVPDTSATSSSPSDVTSSSGVSDTVAGDG